MRSLIGALALALTVSAGSVAAQQAKPDSSHKNTPKPAAGVTAKPATGAAAKSGTESAGTTGKSRKHHGHKPDSTSKPKN